MANVDGDLTARQAEKASHGGLPLDREQPMVAAAMVFGATSNSSSGMDDSGKGSSVGNPEIAEDTLEDLASQWQEFSIAKGIEDGVVIVANDSVVQEEQESGNGGGCCLVGSLLSIRGGGPKLIEKAMTAAWGLLRPMKMEIVDVNLMAFRFESELDYNKVLREGPWRFDEFLMAFKEVGKGPMPSKEDLTTVPFWVQVIGLPVKWQNDRMLRYVGGRLGQVMDSDPTVRKLEGTWEQFMRVRVDLSILSELPRGTVLRYGKEEYPLAFKYERLPNFCFYCGFVDHVVMDCEKLVLDGKSVEDCKYGMWLKGYPPRGMHPGMLGGINVGAASRNPFARAAPAQRGGMSLAARASQGRVGHPPGFPPKATVLESGRGGNPFGFTGHRPPAPSLALPSSTPKTKPPPKRRQRKTEGSSPKVALKEDLNKAPGDGGGRNKKKRVAEDSVTGEEVADEVGVYYPDPIMQ